MEEIVKRSGWAWCAQAMSPLSRLRESVGDIKRTKGLPGTYCVVCCFGNGISFKRWAGVNEFVLYLHKQPYVLVRINRTSFCNYAYFVRLDDKQMVMDYLSFVASL